MRSPFFPVASLAIDVFVGPVTGDDRVEGFGAIATLVAFPVPFATLCQHLLGGEHDATATWTTLARWGLDHGGVNHGRARGSIATLKKLPTLPSIRSTDEMKHRIARMTNKCKKQRGKCASFLFRDTRDST